MDIEALIRKAIERQDLERQVVWPPLYDHRWFKETKMTEEEYADRLRDELEAAEKAIRENEEWAATVRAKIADLEPPFEVGDTVWVKKDYRLTQVRVLAIERAFGEWVVKVEFYKSPGKPYYYPAKVLEK